MKKFRIYLNVFMASTLVWFVYMTLRSMPEIKVELYQAFVWVMNNAGMIVEVLAVLGVQILVAVTVYYLSKIYIKD